MNEPTIAGAVVRDPKGRLFVQRRAAHRRLFPGCWDIVGGAIEPGENAHDALEREIREETGWRLRSVLNQVCDETWTSAGVTHREVVFLVEVEGDLGRPDVETDKVVEYRWIDGPQDARVLEANCARGGSDFVGRVIGRCLDIGGFGVIGGRPRALLVGFAGQQGRELIEPMRRHADVVGGVDPCPEASLLATEAGFPLFKGLEEAIRAVSFDVAVVTIPHSKHYLTCRMLLAAGKHVLKEKPFTVDLQEAEELIGLAEAGDVSIYTLVQRRFHPAFDFARKHIPLIGTPYWFSYDYHANLSAETTGWRGTTETACGGVLMDMGYHALDVLTELLPKPAEVRSTFLHCYESMHRRRLEDFATVLLNYEPPTLAGMLNVSRHHHTKTERLTVLGRAGALEVSPGGACLFSPGGKPVDDVEVAESKEAIQERMVASYLRDLSNEQHRTAHLRQQKSVVALLRRAYGNDPDELTSDSTHKPGRRAGWVAGT